MWRCSVQRLVRQGAESARLYLLRTHRWMPIGGGLLPLSDEVRLHSKRRGLQAEQMNRRHWIATALVSLTFVHACASGSPEPNVGETSPQPEPTVGSGGVVSEPADGSASGGMAGSAAGAGASAAGASASAAGTSASATGSGGKAGASLADAGGEDAGGGTNACSPSWQPPKSQLWSCCNGSPCAGQCEGDHLCVCTGAGFDGGCPEGTVCCFSAGETCRPAATCFGG